MVKMKNKGKKENNEKREILLWFGIVVLLAVFLYIVVAVGGSVTDFLGAAGSAGCGGTGASAGCGFP